VDSAGPLVTEPRSGDATDSTPAGGARIDWLRVWLAGLAFLYPAFWLANSLFLAAPSLLRVALVGDRLEDFRLLPAGVLASSTPRNLMAGGVRRHASPFSIEILVPVALAIVVLLAVACRRNRTLSGLVAATLGNVLLIPPLASILFLKRNFVRSALSAVLFFAILCLGLGWMLDAWVGSKYWRRAGSALVGFVLPLAVAYAGLRWFSFEFRPVLLILIVPGVLAALLVAGRTPWREPYLRRRAVGWRSVAVGAVISLGLAAGIGPAGRAVSRAMARGRAARVQAEMAAIPAVPTNAPYPRVFFQRGVNFTAEWPARYDSEAARQMLRRLPAYGINAIALVPYGWSSAKPPRVHIGGGPDTWESDEGVEILARLAHSLGMKVMLKPAIWDSYKLEIDSTQDRATWFEQYGLFLDHYARMATRIHADVLFVGGEFDHLSEYDADWRRLIAGVRPLYPGPLTYGANFGKEFETLPFWDALDLIGLQEYYPLPDNLSTDSLVQKVEAVQRKYGKPVIFSEAGFPAYQSANRQPWEDTQGGKVDVAEQARCYDAILRAFYKQPWFDGVYWWKVGTNDEGDPTDGSLTPWGKPAMDVVKRWYLEGGR